MTMEIKSEKVLFLDSVFIVSPIKPQRKPELQANPDSGGGFTSIFARFRNVVQSTGHKGTLWQRWGLVLVTQGRDAMGATSRTRLHPGRESVEGLMQRA